MLRYGRGLLYMYNEFIMLKTPRDLEILKLVGRFGQLKTSQISDILFADRFHTRAKDVLKRLYDSKLLIRIDHTLVTVERGGSGEYVYALGRAGWQQVYTGRYRVKQTIYPHTLDIADAYVKLLKAQRSGLLDGLVFKPESLASVTVGGQLLKPDAYVRYTVGGMQVAYWLEVDKGTEHLTQIAGLIERYRQAYLNYDEAVDTHQFIGIVLQVACEPRKAERRVNELVGILNRVPEAPMKAFFKVGLFETFPQASLLGK